MREIVLQPGESFILADGTIVKAAREQESAHERMEQLLGKIQKSLGEDPIAGFIEVARR